MIRQWIAPVCVVILLMATCTMARAYQADRQPGFGTYSKAYQDRQQAKRCKKVKSCRIGDNYQRRPQ